MSVKEGAIMCEIKNFIREKIENWLESVVDCSEINCGNALKDLEESDSDSVRNSLALIQWVSQTLNSQKLYLRKEKIINGVLDRVFGKFSASREKRLAEAIEAIRSFYGLNQGFVCNEFDLKFIIRSAGERSVKYLILVMLYDSLKESNDTLSKKAFEFLNK